MTAGDTIKTPEGEYSALGVDLAAGPDRAVAVRPCRFCEVPVEQPTGRHRHMAKDFCSAKHRAAFREAEHQKALATAVEAIEHARDVVEQALAQLEGARQVLARFQKKAVHGCAKKIKKDLTRPG